MNCYQSGVSIFNGWNTEYNNKLATLCGNLESHLPVLRSNVSNMIISYKGDHSNPSKGFEAVVYFTLGKNGQY